MERHGLLGGNRRRSEDAEGGGMRGLLRSKPRRQKGAKEVLKEYDGMEVTEEQLQEWMQPEPSARKAPRSAGGYTTVSTSSSGVGNGRPSTSINVQENDWEQDVLVSAAYGGQNTSRETKCKYALASIMVCIYIVLLVSVIAVLAGNRAGVLDDYKVDAKELAAPEWWSQALNRSGIASMQAAQMSATKADGSEAVWLFGATLRKDGLELQNVALVMQLETRNHTVKAAEFIGNEQGSPTQVIASSVTESKEAMSVTPTSVFADTSYTNTYVYWEVSGSSVTAHGLGRVALASNRSAMQVQRLFGDFSQPRLTPCWVMADKARTDLFGLFSVKQADSGHYSVFIGRLDAANIANNQDPYLFWDGSHNSNADSFRVPFHDASSIASSVGPHVSVHWNVFLNAYVMLYAGSTGQRASQLFLRTATDLRGPYSNEYMVYQHPSTGAVLTSPNWLLPLTQTQGQTMTISAQVAGTPASALPVLLRMSFNPVLEKII